MRRLWMIACLVTGLLLVMTSVYAQDVDDELPPAEETPPPDDEAPPPDPDDEAPPPDDEASPSTDEEDEDEPEEGNIPAEAEYLGLDECDTCHRDVARDHEESRHALALIDVQDDDDFLVADFDENEDIRTIPFPGEDTPRPLTENDIAFAIGSGRYVQRYLYRMEDDSLRLLPVEWNSQTEQWQPYAPGADWLADDEYQWANCAACHTTGYQFEEKTWVDNGVQCEACHGPGSEHVELVDEAGSRPNDEELAALRAAIVVSPDAQICGQCHSAGMDTATGLPYPVGYLPGEDLTASYSIAIPDDTSHWHPSGHAAHKNMQYNEWLTSAHAQSLLTVQENDFQEDSCLRCHSADYAFNQRQILAAEEGDREGDPPEPITVADAEYGVTCISCHNVHAEGEVDFYLEQDNYALCTDCHTDPDLTDRIHAPHQQMFEGQPVVLEVQPVPSGHFTAENGPDCVTCHLPESPVGSWLSASHTLQIVPPAAAIEGQTTCTTCHSEQAGPDEMQTLIEDIQTGTEAQLTTIQAALTGDEPEWVTQAVAFVAADNSLGVHNYPYTSLLLNTVQNELGLTPTQPAPEITVPSAAVEVDEADPGTMEQQEVEADSEVQAITPVTIVIMVASVLLIAYAGWVFFFKQGRAA